MHSTLELDENQMRAMVTIALDRVMDHLRGLSTAPISNTSRGGEIAKSLLEPIPEESLPFETLIGRIFDDIIPATVNTASPGYCAYIPSGGIFHAAVAEFVAKAVNRYVGYWFMAPAVAQLEWTVIRWFCTMMGYGDDSGGVFTSGASMANLTAMIAARTTRLPEDSFQQGIIYITSQTHFSIAKAAGLAGFPSHCLRIIDVDSEFRMDPRALNEAIAADRIRTPTRTPFMVVGTAGTTNTGAVDPLDDIALIASRENLWFHVDGAYGAFFMLVDEAAQRMRGIERADSISLDPHKGLCLPYGTGALVTKRRASLERAFGARADYVPQMNDVENEIDFCGLSTELSRDWRGLRIWLPIKMHGIGPFRDNIAEKLALTRDALDAIRALPNIEIVATPQLTIFAFRLNPNDRSEADLDHLNRVFLNAILRRQRIMLSATTLDGRFVIRMALLSFRTHADRIHDGIIDIRDAAAEVLETTVHEATG